MMRVGLLVKYQGRGFEEPILPSSEGCSFGLGTFVAEPKGDPTEEKSLVGPVLQPNIAVFPNVLNLNYIILY